MVLPSKYIIGIIIFTFFIVGGMAMLSEFNNSDPTFSSDPRYSQFNESFDKMNEVTENVNSLKSGIVNTSSKSDFGAIGVLSSLIQSTWNALTLMLSSFNFMDDAFNALAIVFGIPNWVGSLITLLVAVTLIFAIWGAIFQRDL